MIPLAKHFFIKGLWGYLREKGGYMCEIIDKPEAPNELHIRVYGEFNGKQLSIEMEPEGSIRDMTMVMRNGDRAIQMLQEKAREQL